MKLAEVTRDITPNVTQVNADQVWDMGDTGQGVVVALIDVGVNYNHLDLVGHLWDGGAEFPNHGWDVYDNDNDPMDMRGHGTHCAGTVCGDGSAGRQTGMAPDVTLMCVKATDDEGYGNVAYGCAGIQFAVEHGADMFSMSLGWKNPSVANRELARNTCVAALDAGIIGAIAAGNEAKKLTSTYPIPNNVVFPAGCPPPYLDPVQQANPGGLSCSVCVGAVDYNDIAADFSSHGPVKWSQTSYADYPYSAGSSTEFGLIRPDVCAPGVDIISANYSGISGYRITSGTSMAAPCVAGCMALMLSKNPELTPADICRILEETAVPLAEGKSNIYGYGRVNALAAVNAVPDNILSYASHVIHDQQGNNDHILNPGESVTLDLDLRCGPDALNNTTLHITTPCDFITITNGDLALPDFAAGQTLTIPGFAFTVSDDAPVRRKVTFNADVLVDGTSMGHFAFTLLIIGTDLVMEGAVIENDTNGNGTLEPGETANLHIFINNTGNKTSEAVTGSLSTTSTYLTINTESVSLGDVGIYEPTYINFNVTLSANATNAFPIPCTLSFVDAEDVTTAIDFSLYNITTSSNPQGTGVLSGSGTYGTGTEVTLSAISDNSHTFIRWKKGNTLVSYANYIFNVSENAHYVAVFDELSNAIPLGQATRLTEVFPTNSYYCYSITEQIYTAEELGSAQEFTSIAFFSAGTTKTRNFRIYLKQTNKTRFTEGGNDWVSVVPGDLVFEGDVTFTAGGWVSIPFDRTFAYDGSHNVLLVVDDNTGDYSRGLKSRVYETDDLQALFYYGDGTNFDPYDLSNTPAYSYLTRKNQILLGIAPDNIGEKTMESTCFIKDKILYVNAESNNIQLDIIDVLGRKVKSVKMRGNSCSVADLKTGVYLVRLTDGSNTTTNKVVVY